MSDSKGKDSTSKDFVAGVGSDQRKSPVRVAFVTRRTSAQVKAYDEMTVQSFPEVLFRAAIAVEVLAIVLVLISLFFNAPLEGMADPTHTPNPAKAPWYFLGLQELLHYFPPTTAGVLIPGLVLTGLVILPYVDRNPSRAFNDRKMAIVTFTMFAVFWAFVTLAGSFFRGPGWAWIWPWNGMYFDL